ncbi:hypothetical protein AN958_11080, partial [Leucoagaricus sp. SymC.cos]
CDCNGSFLPANFPPPPLDESYGHKGNWYPFENEQQFKAADFLYRESLMSAKKLDKLISLWGKSQLFKNHDNLYSMVDKIPYGDIEWKGTDPHRCISLPSYDPKYSPSELIIPRTAIAAWFELKTLWKEYGIVGDIIICLLFAENFPCGDIYSMLSPDILYQLIKGIFKDHLVSWIEEYLTKKSPYSPKEEREILSKINHQISLAPPFKGLGFKQWTGDDSKALMKVYISALEDFIPTEMICTLHAFLEFCYIVQKEVIISESLNGSLQEALDHFHEYCDTFVQNGVWQAHRVPPHQHSLIHYCHMICAFGALNGLCSSITESKHIQAVKEPYQFDTLKQMLITNSQMDKLASASLDLQTQIIDAESEDLVATLFSERHEHDDDDNDDPEVSDATYLERSVDLAKKASGEGVAPHIPHSHLVQLLHEYLLEFYHEANNEIDLLLFDSLLFSTFHSVVATFYVPSDVCRTNGMISKRIRAVSLWKKQGSQYDTIFVKQSPDNKTISTSLQVAQACLFFSFIFQGEMHKCALIECYHFLDSMLDEDSGIWTV